MQADPPSPLAAAALEHARVADLDVSWLIDEALGRGGLNDGIFALSMARSSLLGRCDAVPDDLEVIVALGLVSAAGGRLWTRPHLDDGDSVGE